MKTTILVLAGMFLALTGCSNKTDNAAKETNQTSKVTDTANQKENAVNDANQTSGTIETKVGKTFTVTLPANRTTGYSWQIGEFTPGIVKMISEDYTLAENTRGLVGAGGEQIWTFEAVNAGEVTIHFEYARPWEKNIPAIKKADYSITITK
jgi:inhibitor of cysteine peptidase